MYKKISIGLALFATGAFAQVSENYKQLQKQENANYYEIVAAAKDEFARKDLSKLANKKAVKQFNRWAYFWENRVNEDGSFPSEIQEFVNAGVLKNGATGFNKNSRVASSQNWVNVGPKQSEINNNGYSNYPQVGRLNAFLRIPHPSDASQDVLLVGAPNGGIWKSTDGGSTWSPKLDQFAAIGVTDIKTVPGTTTENYTNRPIYVSTGDADGSQANSIGVIKSTNGGESFSVTGFTQDFSNGNQLGDLIVIDANTVIVGGQELISGNKLGVIKRTTDGGATWTTTFSTSYTNMKIDRVAVSGNKAMYTGIYGEFYYCNNITDSSPSWIMIGSANSYNRSAITVGHDGEFYVQPMNGQVKKFNTNTNALTEIGNIPNGYQPQSGYNQALVVDADRMITGEFNGQHSINSGASWYKSLNGYWSNSSSDGSYIHSDHHRLGRIAQHKYWSVNDGGLSYIDYSSNANKPVINYLSGDVKVTQLYSVAINPTATDASYLIANQDNDALTKKGNQWFAIAMGDGIQSAVDYQDPNIRYAGNQNGYIAMSNTGFEGQLSGVAAVQVPGAYFNFPLEMNKTTPTILYAGGGTNGAYSDVHKITRSGNSLVIQATNSGLSGAIKTIATHGNVVMASDGDDIKKSIDGASSWTTVSKPSELGSIKITSVDFKASDANTIYITAGGYNTGKKVYKTTDGGSSWAGISNGLPNIVMNEVIAYQNQSTETLFVATNLGVYKTENGGSNWSKLGNNLPNVDVKDLDIHYTGKKLVAATFGRGLWEVSIDQSALGFDTELAEVSQLNLYPNPTSSQLYISTNSADEYNYVIYNVVGGVVSKGAVSNNPIDVSTLVKGVYMVRVYNHKSSTTKQIVIK